jgi:hypothetical protein
MELPDGDGQAVECGDIYTASLVGMARQLIQIVAELARLARPAAERTGEVSTGGASRRNLSARGKQKNLPCPSLKGGVGCLGRALESLPLGGKEAGRDRGRPLATFGPATGRLRA